MVTMKAGKDSSSSISLNKPTTSSPKRSDSPHSSSSPREGATVSITLSTSSQESILSTTPPPSLPSSPSSSIAPTAPVFPPAAATTPQTTADQGTSTDPPSSASAPTSPQLSLPKDGTKESDGSNSPPKPSKQPTKCPLEKCLLCTREQPHCLTRSPTWPAIMRVVFYTLKCSYPDKDFFNLKEDVYGVMLFHWSKLSINKKSASNWKKHIQDMLSHSKELFESGLEIYGQNGYWKLKVVTDPWTLSGKTRRSPKKGLGNLKRPLEDSNPAEQMMRRPFIPYIAKETTKHTPTAQPMSYVFVNEQSVPQQRPTPPPTPAKEPEPPVISPVPYNVPNPLSLSQRYAFVPVPVGSQSPQQSSPFPAQFPLSHSGPIAQELAAAPFHPSISSPTRAHPYAFRPHARHAASLPSSRRQSPQRSRSPSPQPQSMPTSPRTAPPYSAPTSPSSRSVPSSPSRGSSRRSSRSSPYSMPQSPRSQPLSPGGSPPPSPHATRMLRALRSPPSPSSPTPQTPLSPRSPPANDEALDALRTTFEHFNWAPASHESSTQNSAHNSAPGTPELHHLAFNVFAAAKPANPCDVSFLLNE